MATITEAQVVEQVLDWFNQAWDPSLPLLAWRQRLVESGWAVPSWSSRWYGRDLPAWAGAVAHEAIREAGGVAVPLGSGMGLAAPTMYDHGSEELKARYLAPTLTGELTWCQLFSEPVAGSDLAGLRTTAVRDGDDWVVNGQKVWTTSAHHADMAILITRTDWDVPKHAGMTFFVIDMHQPGVEVHPIKQMNYHASFNEVFLTDARVPNANIVGELGGGWRVARGTLAHERSFSTQRNVFFHPDAAGRVIEEARVEAADYLETYKWYPQRMGRVDLAISRIQSTGRADDRVVRNELAALLSFQRAAEWTASRAKAAQALGRPPGSEGSIGKLALSHIARACNRLYTTTGGPIGMLSGGADPQDEAIAEVLISTPAQSIAGGTDEIQHNILGENMLGLAKEPDPNRGKPFREEARL